MKKTTSNVLQLKKITVSNMDSVDLSAVNGGIIVEMTVPLICGKDTRLFFYSDICTEAIRCNTLNMYSKIIYCPE